MNVADLAGADLGTRDVTYGDRDAILYALATGASETDLDLVYERDLRVMPTFGLTLALWVVEAAGDLGAYDRLRSLHAQQRLEVKLPLPAAATLAVTGRVTGVWDKGKAAMVDIEADCPYFTATYSVFLPGYGGWGGERGSAPVAAASPGQDVSEITRTYATRADQAAWYRLTGDRHPVHVDPAAAKESGFDRPILHGLCTLGIATRETALALGHHPADLRSVTARFAAPVYPGDELRTTVTVAPTGTHPFHTTVGDQTVIANGTATFT